MKATPLKIVVTGSECTGKTTLAGELGARYRAPVSAEYARHYVGLVHRPLEAADVETIARGQLREEDTAICAAGAVVVLDTDLVSTVVYATHYYGACPPWIVSLARQRAGDLYLLLHPDVPWVADGLKRDRSGARQVLHDAFDRQLRSWGLAWWDVTGGWGARRRLAFRVVDDVLAGRGRRRGV